MGYETKLVIGYPFHSWYEPDGSVLINRVAEVDLSKCGSSSYTGLVLSAARKNAAVNYSYYADDGNTRIDEDNYDDKLTAVDIKSLIAAMVADNKVYGEYRRYTVAIGLLRAFKVKHWKSMGLVCVQYGH